MKKLIKIVLLSVCMVPVTALGEGVLVEIDPLTFAKDGYSLHLRYKLGHFALGAGGYALDLPQFVTEINASNKGWEDRIDSGIVLFLDYLFDNSLEGWLVGLEFTHQKHIVSYENEEAEFGAMLYLLRAGYHYRPLSKSSLYFFPWVGAGYMEQTSGNRSVETLDKEFDISPVAGFATLHVGYEF
jgi:hypothetical protein